MKTGRARTHERTLRGAPRPPSDSHIETRLPREELLEWALLLRERSWPVGQIAEQLCISRSYASALLNDRDGEKDKARRRSYGGTCWCGACTRRESQAA